jgi:acyl-CoA dehydrogenase
MQTLAIIVIALTVFLALGYSRAPFFAWVAVAIVAFLALASVGHWPGPIIGVGLTLIVGFCAVFLVSGPVLELYKRVLPAMSATEREAIEAGTVWWDAALFSGDPDWDRLLELPAPRLSKEEQAFLDGPVEELCRMVDDWQVTSSLHDLPAEVWDFVRTRGFFGMIIPRRYGGLEFSALAHSAVVMKLASRSGTLGVTVMVPNSLGPAELLLHYGTQEQKDNYLPRLARGEEIPCFALTGPEAGSDASAMQDIGVVCRDRFGDRDDVLGVRLNWEKRYITLGPVATLLGLAFKLRDPDRLIGDDPDPGITLALIPTDTPGITIGARHMPMTMAFHNGPNAGHDVFIPIDWIIGGPAMAGRGWMMLMESLAAGRSISLPALATGSGKLGSLVTGAYAAVRRQFKTPVGQFEGVQEALARIGGNAYLMDAARVMTCAAVDRGEKPSVISAIVKYHLTERMRQVINDAMDVHGGRGICMGPRNYLAPAYQGVPIAITVEGANILTRSLIIFGQGAIRCHPYVLREMEAARHPDAALGLEQFDAALFAHVGHTLSNACRTLVLGLTGARFAKAPADGALGYYYRQVTRMSAALAISADVAMLLLGARLKRLERLSARLGDVLSFLYLASAAIKRFEDDGRPEADRPLLHWACRDALFRVQVALDELFRNLPVPGAGWLLARLVFPLGHPYGAPNDANDRRVARLLLRPSATRDRLTGGVYIGSTSDAIGRVEDALLKVTAAQGAMRKLQRALRAGELASVGADEQIQEALGRGIIDAAEAALLANAEAARSDAIMVDDFAPDLSAIDGQAVPPERPRATRRAARRATVRSSEAGY